MNLIIINNSGFVKHNNSYFITRTTGEFLLEINHLLKNKIYLFQFVENGIVDEGINDFKVDDHFQIEFIFFNKDFRKILSYIYAIKAILKLIRNNEDFIYIFYPGNFSTLVSTACLIFKKKYGLYVRGEYNSWISKIIFKNAKFINTVGTVFQNEIKLYNNNCNLIRPMVQFDFNKSNFRKNHVKKNEILFVGRIEKRKGVFEIVEAAKKIKEIFPNYIFRLIGAGTDSEKIANLVDKNGLDNIILQGPVFISNDLAKFYQESKIFLFPSHDEGFPRVLYEAMYFRLPIITTFVGNIPGIMSDEYNCLEIKVQSSESIVNQIKKLIKNDDLSEIIVNNSEKSLFSVFNKNVIPHSELLVSQLDIYEQ